MCWDQATPSPSAQDVLRFPDPQQTPPPRAGVCLAYHPTALALVSYCEAREQVESIFSRGLMENPRRFDGMVIHPVGFDLLASASALLQCLFLRFHLMTDDKSKYSDETWKTSASSRKRMYLCWLEMTGAEIMDVHLAEMHSIDEELSRILETCNKLPGFSGTRFLSAGPSRMSTGRRVGPRPRFASVRAAKSTKLNVQSGLGELPKQF
jgi:hypothetical protein